MGDTYKTFAPSNWLINYFHYKVLNKGLYEFSVANKLLKS